MSVCSPPMRGLYTMCSVAGGAALAVAILACGGGGRVIAPEVAEHAISEGLKDKGLETTKVTCPSDQKAIAGATFTCEAITKDGDDVPVDVKILDATGRVDWGVRGVIVHEKLMADGITAKANGAIQVKCPDKVIVVPVGGHFTCEAGSGGSVQHIEIEIVDHEGNETWKLVP